MDLAAALAVEGDDRHAPHPLARQAPVGAVLDHAADAVAAPVRHPGGVVDLGQRALAQLGVVDRDEPLRGGAEQDRPLAPPAVGVAVAQRLARLVEQVAGLVQVFDDVGVGVPRLAAGPARHLVGELAGVVERRVRLEPVVHAGDVVLGAVAGRGVDQPGALLEGDVVGEPDPEVVVGARRVDERMVVAGAFQRLQFVPGDRDPGRAVGLGVLVQRADGAEERRRQLAGDDQMLGFLVRAWMGQGDVLEARVQDDGQVGRQRPRRRRPDRQGQPGAGQPLVEGGRVEPGLQREAHIDRWRRVVLVFDLGFGQRGLVARAPVDRLLAAEQIAATGKRRQCADDGRLVGRLQRQVRVLPAAEHAQPAELAALDVDEAQRVLLARGADVGLGHAQLLVAQVAVDLELDRQAVGIPAGHVRRPMTHHRVALDHEILEDLVEHVAVVNVPVGVRWSVVQDVGRRVLARLLDPLVQPAVFPRLQHLRLAPSQVAAHGKRSLGEVDRVLVLSASHREPGTIALCRGHAPAPQPARIAGIFATTGRSQKNPPTRLTPTLPTQY